MPKKVPSEYTGRFSVKPKKSSSKTKDEKSASPSLEKQTAPLPEGLQDESALLQERKRKKSGQDEDDEGGTSSQTRDEAEGLNIYSQQLEVQPPFKKRRIQKTKKIESQGQQLAIASTSHQDMTPLHQQVSNREPETLPNSAEPHRYHEEALAILQRGWQLRASSQPDIQETARTLAHRATNVPSADSILFLRTATRAILEYGSQQPQSIDYMLLAFSESLKLLPETLTSQHGGGTEATITQLKWLLLQEIHGFNGFLLPQSPGIIDLEDHSNVKFGYDSVSSNLEAVLVQIRDWKWQRRLWFVAAASQARCFALDILRKKVGEQIEALIDAGLDRKQKRWSKVDMLGACVLLRGCAQSLKSHVPTSKIKIFAWKESLEKLLLQDEESWDNDFVIKAHAAVRNPLLAYRHFSPLADLANTFKLALTNLIDGPFDETSEQLFAPGSWVF